MNSLDTTCRLGVQRIATFLFIAMCGCRVVFWGTVYSSSGPAGELRVQEKGCFADCAVQIVVTHGWRTKQIAWKSDCVITFAHAAWSGSRVAAFVDGSVCGQICAAYDTASDKMLDFNVVEPWLRASIIEAYKVTPEELHAYDEDVFTWATYPGDGEPRRSMEEFRRRYRP